MSHEAEQTLQVNFEHAMVINQMVSIIHENNKRAGWWSNLKYPSQLKKLTDMGLDESNAKSVLDALNITEKADRNVGELLALVHSEVSEALEGHRKNLMDDKLPNRKMIETELADVVIRSFDITGGLNLDLGGAIQEKLKYNRSREDHKVENRLKDNGKSY